MKAMNIKQNNFYFAFVSLLLICSCSLSPGMHFDSNSNWLEDEDYVYIDSIEKKIFIKDIKLELTSSKNSVNPYKIGKGDQIAITVWGLPDIFPISNINPDTNLRRVDSNGNIYFPYVGVTKAEGKTQNELRENLAKSLEGYFNNPQLDVSIARFNSQKVYLLGEVSKPVKLNITDIPISLSDALGEALGINTNTGSGSEVFIIRQGNNAEVPQIYKADLSSPAGFITANNFYLTNNDIVYVNAQGTARWNRVVSQFFPFSSFLNSVDNLTKD